MNLPTRVLLLLSLLVFGPALLVTLLDVLVRLHRSGPRQLTDLLEERP